MSAFSWSTFSCIQAFRDCLHQSFYFSLWEKNKAGLNIDAKGRVNLILKGVERLHSLILRGGFLAMQLHYD